jgi:hypothetical protein
METLKRQGKKWADSPGSDNQMAKRVPNNAQRRGDKESMKNESISRKLWRTTTSTKRKNGRISLGWSHGSWRQSRPRE